jgi:hypothetical protein
LVLISKESRRGVTWVNRFMFGLFGLFVLGTLGQALVGSVTLLDVNLLTRFAPWRALHGLDILTTNICRSDTVDSVMPSIAEIRWFPPCWFPQIRRVLTAVAALLRDATLARAGLCQAW